MSFRPLLIILAVSIFSRPATAGQTPVGYLILKEENKLGVTASDESYKVLNDLVDECKKEINTREMKPREIMSLIGSNIAKFNFIFENNRYFYANAIANRKFDCDQFAITYLTIARSLDLPVYAVVMPSHMAVIWDDESPFLWETTINTESDSIGYILSFHISEASIKHGVWLNKIPSKKETALVFNYLGEHLLVTKDYQKSKTYLEKALSELSDFPPSKNNLAVVLMKEGRLAESRKLMIDVLENDPLNYISLNNIGLLFFNDRKVDSALFYYDKSVRINDKFPDSRYNRGLALGQLKQYDKAMEDFDAAIALYDKHSIELSDCFMNKGVCQLYKKDYKESIENFSLALERDPNNSNAVVDRAIAKYSLGDKPGACEDIRQAVKMGNATASSYVKRICP